MAKVLTTLRRRLLHRLHTDPLQNHVTAPVYDTRVPFTDDGKQGKTHSLTYYSRKET